MELHNHSLQTSIEEAYTYTLSIRRQSAHERPLPDTFGLRVRVVGRPYRSQSDPNYTGAAMKYPISTSQLLSNDTARSCFSELLSSAEITTLRDDLFRDLLSSCRAMMTCRTYPSSTCIANVLFLCITIVVDEAWVPRRTLDESMDFEYEFKTRPASKSSVEALEKVIAIDGSGMDPCMVCLEKFRDVVEVTRMPCSHFYHGDCIVRWLETSHHCPLCRFEMPTV